MRDESTLFRDLIAFALEWKERLTLISTPYLSLIVRTLASHQGDGEKRHHHIHSPMTTFSSSKQAHTSAAIPIPSRYSMTDDNNSFSPCLSEYSFFIQLTPFPRCFCPVRGCPYNQQLPKRKKKVQEIKIKPKSLTGKYLPTW